MYQVYWDADSDNGFVLGWRSFQSCIEMAQFILDLAADENTRNIRCDRE